MDDKDDIDDEDDDKPRSSSDFFGQSSLVTRTGSLSGFQQMAFSSITPKAVLLRFSFPARTSLSSSTRGRQGTFEDSDEDLMAPTPLPPPPSVKAMSEGKGHRKSEETVRDLEMEIEKLQARLEKKRLLEKSEQIASTSESDSTQGQRSDNSVQGQRPDNRECETVPKVERSNSNEVGEELGKATEKAKDSRKDVVIENNINVPLKSADKGDVPISKLLKKDSYSKTTFNQEHFLNSVLSGPPPSAKKDSRGRGALGVPPEAKITGASAKDIHRSPKQIADGVNNDLVGERESLYWKGMGSNPDSGWDVMEEGVFENQFLEVESDVLEITLPPNPNIPHTKATRTGDYVKTEETNSGSSSVKTADFKSSSVDGFQNESISGETLSVNEHTPDSQNQSGYSDDSMGPPNLPPLKYPDHPPSTSFTSEDSSHSTQLPPKRKSQEMKTSSADGSTLKSELDEKDISDYQEFNNSSRSNYSKVPQTADNNAFHTVSSYTTYMASLQSLADHHGYVIKDVTPDGNCMFSAIVDQLRIQGNFDLTPNSLRKTAVEFLRDNPKNQDGTHLESYLSTETWDEYLTRMGQDSQWGDHMVLQACTEVTGQRIVVFKPNSNKTELVPTDDKSSENSSLTLGHIGESHFVSLRPKDWESSWPLMAHAHRAKMKEKQKLERKKLRKMKKSKKQKQTSESTLPKKEDPKSSDETETEKGAELTEGATQEDEAEREPEKDEDDNSDEDEAESDDSQFKTTDDIEELVRNLSSIDTLSLIPMGHLSHILKMMMAARFLLTVPAESAVLQYESLARDDDNTGYRMVHFGSVVEEFSTTMTNLSPKRYQSIVPPIPKMIGYSVKDNILPSEKTRELGDKEIAFITDDQHTHPGYVRVKLCIGGNAELVKQLFANSKHSEYHLHKRSDERERKLFMGIRCLEWPDEAKDWFTRDRPAKWPSEEILELSKGDECFLISRPHPQSSHPDAEWQWVFPTTEIRIARDALSNEQKYCFRVFKVLVNFHTRNLPVRLSTTHLKTVMYSSCEVIPADHWKLNPGACLLFLLHRLLVCLRIGVLPNFFIPANNMIDHFSKGQLCALRQRLYAVRVFPVTAVFVIVDDHDVFGSCFLDGIMEDIIRFRKHQNLHRSTERCFLRNYSKYFHALIMSGQFSNAKLALEDAFLAKTSVNQSENVLCENCSFEQFSLNFTEYEFGELKGLVAFELDMDCESDFTRLLHCPNHIVYLKDILDADDCLEYSEVPIHRHDVDSRYKEVTFLENLTLHFTSRRLYQKAAHFLRCVIRKALDAIQHNDQETVQPTTDSESCMSRTDNSRYNYALLRFYHDLYRTYKSMGQTELMQEYIEDYEAVCMSCDVPFQYNRVANIWQKLGNNARAKTLRDQADLLKSSRKFCSNVSRYDSFDDVD